MRLRTGLFPVALCAVLSLACGSDSTTAPNQDPVGVHNLVSVNGNSLPFVVTTGDGQFELISGQFTFSTGGGCVGAITVREVGTTGTEVMSNTCTWSRVGTQVTIQWTEGVTDTGTYQGSTLTFVASDIAGLTLVFKK